jgi:hypothetical protein
MRSIRLTYLSAVIARLDHGLTGRSSNHRPGILDCQVKPGNDTREVSLMEKCSGRIGQREVIPVIARSPC